MYLQLRGLTKLCFNITTVHVDHHFADIIHCGSERTRLVHCRTVCAAANPCKPSVSKHLVFAPPSATKGRQRFQTPGHTPKHYRQRLAFMPRPQTNRFTPRASHAQDTQQSRTSRRMAWQEPNTSLPIEPFCRCFSIASSGDLRRLAPLRHYGDGTS